MTPTLVFHVGDFKTGTSSIQATLARNPDPLLAAGVDYPQPSANRVSHLDLALAMRRRHRDDISLLAQFSRNVSNCEVQHVVLSSEVFQESLLGGHDLPGKETGVRQQIVYYVRPHTDAFIARYLQRLKLCKPVGTVDVFLDTAIRYKLFNFEHRIRIFERQVGEANVVVRPYVKSLLKSQDVVADFCSLLSLDIKGLELLPAENVTPGPKAVKSMLLTSKIIDVLNSEQWRENESVLYKLLSKYVAAFKDDPPIYGLSESLSNRMIELYLSDAEFLDAKLGASVFKSSLLSSSTLKPTILDSLVSSMPTDEIISAVSNTIFKHDGLIELVKR
ncbi:MAG: hypothetical protein AAF098_16650 [Pseudomonadota bacterium]